MIDPGVNVGGTIKPTGGFSNSAEFVVYDGPNSRYLYLERSEYWDWQNPVHSAHPMRPITNVYDGAGLTVPLSFFGGTWHNWPNVAPTGIKKDQAGVNADGTGLKFGASRSHDYSPNSIGPVVAGSSNNQGSLRWYALEPTNGDWNYWTNFDKWVGDHNAAGRELMYTLFATPPWATATADQGSNYLPKASNPPDNDADWQDYCTQVATRAAGRIKWWEVWNEPNAGNAWYTGTHARYAELVRLASQAIKAVMPTAKIVGPCVTSWTNTPVGSAASTWFNNALEASDGAGGKCKDWLDAISVHMYQNTYNYGAMPAVTAEIKRQLTVSGKQNLDLIDSESGFITPKLNVESPETVFLWHRRRLIYLAAAGFKATYFYDMDGDVMGYLTVGKYNRNDAVRYWNSIVDELMGGTITRVNMLWDGRLACIIGGQQVLI